MAGCIHTLKRRKQWQKRMKIYRHLQGRCSELNWQNPWICRLESCCLTFILIVFFPHFNNSGAQTREQSLNIIFTATTTSFLASKVLHKALLLTAVMLRFSQSLATFTKWLCWTLKSMFSPYRSISDRTIRPVYCRVRHSSWYLSISTVTGTCMADVPNKLG